MADFVRGTFLGLTVRSYSSAISWGMSTPSTVTVQLVRDEANGDLLTVGEADYGRPVYLEHGGFKFGGLLQKLEERDGPDGRPLWDAVVVDPREILEGAQLIIGGYTGTVGGVANLFNAYGYWEDPTIGGGFGASLSNDAGMPWSQVALAVLDMVNAPGGTDYGGPFSFRGFQYGLDLSQLPSPPAYYRLGGNYIGLMEAVAQVCEDSGYDFTIELVGQTIRVRTTGRAKQPSLGTMSRLAANNVAQNVTRVSAGIEVRNEITSSFLVGGEVTTLSLSSNLRPFWGLAPNGEPITTSGTTNLWRAVWVPPPVFIVPVLPLPGPQVVLAPVQPPDFYDLTFLAGTSGKWVYQPVTAAGFDVFLLNAMPVADLIGATRYECTTLELRCAKANYETWALFINHFRPNIAAAANILGTIQNMGAPLMDVLHPNVVNDNPQLSMALSTDAQVRCMKLYEFVRAYADEYMGRKFLAGVPFVLRKQDDETLKITSTYDVVDGGYLPEGSAPLGLSPLNEDLFMLQDGRFRAFVYYANLAGADLQAVSPQGSCIQNNRLYVPAQIDQNVVLNPTPYVVVTLGGPLADEAVDALGDSNIMYAVMQMAPAQAQRVFQQSFVATRIAPATRRPAAVAVPLKSNVLCYGPWFAAGAPGKVKFEQDSSLTPWNYGGFDTMNNAGNARVLQAVTNMQLSEVATREVAGTPTISLGDVLQAGGPNLTGIDVQIGPGGSSTTYRFQTFTPRFGVGSKAAVERQKRTALAAVELRRSLRVAVREGNSRADQYAAAAANPRGFMANAPPAWRRRSPQDVLVCHSFQDSTNGDVRTWPQSATYQEAVALGNAADPAEYRATAAMSLAGLLRPFSTSPGGGIGMSSYSTAGSATTYPSRRSLDPWKAANDIEVYAWGTAYQGLHAYRRGGDPTQARPLALRGPLVLSGWGFDVYGRRVPNSGDPSQWRQDTLKRQDTWLTGPVDLAWDPDRGVWTGNLFRKGRLNVDCSGGLSAAMRVETSPGTFLGTPMTVWNYFSSTVPADSKVTCSYESLENRWYITAADCTS